jgi:hypothetical protein
MIARSMPAHLRHGQELSQIRRRQFMMTEMALAAGSTQGLQADGQSFRRITKSWNQQVTGAKSNYQSW